MALPDAKSTRYDRQLRLWGQGGQQKLEDARVCIIGAGATGSEILKNLVLPGIGSFTLVDGATVSLSDLGNNFFVTRESLGRSRRVVVTELLRELNDHVQGTYAEEDSPLDLIDNNPNFFSEFTLVIATNVPEVQLLKLASHLDSAKIPLVDVRSYGMVGSVRVMVPEHRVIESKPDNPFDDLRFQCPWPELETYVNQFNFDEISSKDLAHTPYLVILMSALRTWKAGHDGKIPSTRDEKTEFKASIQKMRKDPVDMEESVREAAAHAHKCWSSDGIPSSVRDVIFHDPCLDQLSATTENFWILVAAVKLFVEKEGGGRLPLHGSIPDMASDTDNYIALQTIYNTKAEEHIQHVCAHVRCVLTSVGRESSSISIEEVKTFCKNARYLQVTRYRTLEQEYSAETANRQLIAEELENPDSCALQYLLLRAVSRFHTQYSRYPGVFDDEVEADVRSLRACLTTLMSELDIHIGDQDSSIDSIHEMCRYGACELHNVAALVGGVAAQEVIKALTQQYTLLDNTWIYNGAKGSSTAMCL
eukprot:TRINITY_DN4617_c0_g1_i1.p1 TRINITY_DN4617_c0_g1~~TRINITY_DN4617_c0_g1_i1.p1  ORF type:complete len:614 (+),score=123.26 TRINITY_DN4617_c0_g1_i1:242-1843(+)